MLAVAFEIGEADAGQFYGFSHGRAFFQRFPHLGQVLGVEPFGPASPYALW
jgi:hypothetical protein